MRPSFFMFAVRNFTTNDVKDYLNQHSYSDKKINKILKQYIQYLRDVRREDLISPEHLGEGEGKEPDDLEQYQKPSENWFRKKAKGAGNAARAGLGKARGKLSKIKMPWFRRGKEPPQQQIDGRALPPDVVIQQQTPAQRGRGGQYSVMNTYSAEIKREADERYAREVDIAQKIEKHMGAVQKEGYSYEDINRQLDEIERGEGEGKLRGKDKNQEVKGDYKGHKIIILILFNEERMYEQITESDFTYASLQKPNDCINKHSFEIDYSGGNINLSDQINKLIKSIRIKDGNVIGAGIAPYQNNYEEIPLTDFEWRMVKSEDLLRFVGRKPRSLLRKGNPPDIKPRIIRETEDGKTLYLSGIIEE